MNSATTNVDKSINKKVFTSYKNPIIIPTDIIRQKIKSSNIPNIVKKLELSATRAIELMNKYPKVFELVKNIELNWWLGLKKK